MGIILTHLELRQNKFDIIIKYIDHIINYNIYIKNRTTLNIIIVSHRVYLFTIFAEQNFEIITILLFIFY